MAKENNEISTCDVNDVNAKKRQAFLDLLLDGNENDNQLSDEEIRDEVNTFMFAVSEKKLIIHPVLRFSLPSLVIHLWRCPEGTWCSHIFYQLTLLDKISNILLCKRRLLQVPSGNFYHLKLCIDIMWLISTIFFLSFLAD